MTDAPVTFELDGPEAVERRLAAAAAGRREAHRVRARLATATQEIEARAADVEVARARLADEQEDVERLVGFSMSRILAGLHGRRGADLAREQAEAEAARYAVAEAEDRAAAAVQERAALQDRLAGLGNVDDEWIDALAAKERWITDHDGDLAPRLAEIAAAQGEIDDEVRECDEVRVAAARARARLDLVAAALGSADNWSGVDTWLGGGGLVSAQKHRRLDDVVERIRSSGEALDRLRSELGDIGETLTATISVERWERVFDIFFDNIFSDLSVRHRIKKAIDLVATAKGQVAAVVGDMDVRSARLVARAVDLQTERRRLLTGITD